jgi:hypothetical protein
MSAALPSFRRVGKATHSRQRARWQATLASYTWQGDLDVLVTIEGVSAIEVERIAEAIVALSRGAGAPPAKGEGEKS